MAGFFVLCIIVAGYALIAEQLSSTILTAPMIFLEVPFFMIGLTTPKTGEGPLRPLAEVTLVVLLFLDATQIDFAALKRRSAWLVRMLAIGFGTIAGALFFTEWPIVAIALAAASEAQDSAAWLIFGAKKILLDPRVRIVMGTLGGWALLRAKSKGTTSDVYEGALALAGRAYLMACKSFYEFTETEGQFLTWSAFFLLGATLVSDAIANLTLPMLGLILVSLFIVRPPVAWLSLVGTDAHASTKLFFGWFGPRGLATVLFALLFVESLPHALGQDILHLAIIAVWISAILHEITAASGAPWYCAKTKRRGACPKTRHAPFQRKYYRKDRYIHTHQFS